MSSTSPDENSTSSVPRSCSSFAPERHDECGDRRSDEKLQTVALLKEIDGKLELDESVLESILDPQKLDDLPIAVISIAGAFRMGKSFILNFFLRYFQKKGWRDSAHGAWLKEWSSTEDRGISWKGGAEGHTRGIMALKEPILVDWTNGEQLAVILLDTQGNYEHGRCKEDNVAIFALSTLISSFQIFNVLKQIQTNDMDYLQCFVEFSKLACLGESSDVDVTAGDCQKRFFQDLLFLVRDWSYEIDHAFGIDGGREYLKTLSRSEIDTQVYEYLNQAFSNIQCYLMPEPSEQIRISREEHPSLVEKDIGESFSKSLIDIVDKCINPALLKPKTLGFSGRVTAQQLIDHIKCCANKILRGERPEFPSLMNLVASNANNAALEKAEKQYVTEVAMAIKCMEDPSWPEFDETLKMAEDKARKMFLCKTLFGAVQTRESDLERFKCRISSAYLGVTLLMQQKRYLFMEQKIKLWMDESSEKLKVTSFPYIDIEELDKIREEQETLLPAKHDRDPDSVTILLQDAKSQLKACYDKNVRDGEKRNGAVTKAIFVSSAIGLLLGGPVTIGGVLVGSALAGGVAGVTTAVGIAGIGIKSRLSKIFSSCGKTVKRARGFWRYFGGKEQEKSKKD